MSNLSYPADTVFVVHNPSGTVAAVFATEDAARKDVEAVDDGRVIAPWVLRRASTNEYVDKAREAADELLSEYGGADVDDKLLHAFVSAAYAMGQRDGYAEAAALIGVK